MSWLILSSIMFPAHVVHSLALQSPCYQLPRSDAVYCRLSLPLSPSLRRNIVHITHRRGPIGLPPILPNWDSVGVDLSIPAHLLHLSGFGAQFEDLLIARRARATLSFPAPGGEDAKDAVS
jgi:hypothetical protein